jgi:hypothetical protein
MTTKLLPYVSFDQVSIGSPNEKLHSLNCSIQYGTETAEIMFMDVCDVSLPLELPAARDKLRRSGDALLKAAESAHGVSVDNLTRLSAT